MPDDSLPDVDAPAAAGLLEYASPPAVRERWGPLVFRPSRRSVVLLVLLGVAAVWLGVRHEPWRRVGVVPGDLAVGPAFTGDGLVLAFDSREGANLFDPATGRRVRNVLPRVDPTAERYYVLAGGRRILVLPYNDRTARVYDVGTGRVVERVVNPDGLGSLLVLVAPDGPRLVTMRNGSGSGNGPTTWPSPMTYWDLTRSPPTTRPISLLPRAIGAMFSPDGRRLLDLGSSTASVRLLDGHTLEAIASEARTDDRAPGDGTFLDNNRFWLHWTSPPFWPTAKRRLKPDYFELRSAATGEREAAIPIPAGLAPLYTRSFTATDDGRVWALLAASVPPAGTAWAGVTLYVADVASGRVLLERRHENTIDWSIAAFPGSHRLLAGDLRTRQLAVFEPPHEQPVAVLPQSGPFAGQSTAEISPDGRAILTRTNSGPAALAVPDSVVTLYRPGGWDCPESHLGVLAFPQTWVVAVLLALLAISLTGDARRARRGSARRGVSGWVIAGMLVVALPPTMHHVVAGLVGGGWLHSPAPLLVLLTILLATSARAWRAAAVVAFCGLIPLLAWGGYMLHRVGLRSTIPYRFLDRYYEVPVGLPVAGLAAVSVFVLAGLWLMLRPRAVAS